MPWQAARNGLPSDSNAVDKSAQINQFLSTHGVTPVYQGARVVAPTTGTGAGTADPANFWTFHLDQWDYDQPFTMSGTVTGRVEIPVLPVGAGADLKVGLYTDLSGSPNALIASTRIPATWIRAFAGVAGVAGASASLTLQTTSGPLTVPQFNGMQFGAWTQQPWAGPAFGSSGSPSLPAAATSGNYQIIVGGGNGSNTPVPTVFTSQYLGGTTMSPAVPQPSLPQGTQYAALAVTPDTIVVAGGVTGNPPTTVSAVYTAGWNPVTGVVSAWSTQTSLPLAISGPNAAAYGETVYVVGGSTSVSPPPNGGTGAVATVYYATVQNGQITSWQTGTPLPVGLDTPLVAIIGNTLIVVGGVQGNTWMNTTYYTTINANGSIGTWQQGPTVPTGSWWNNTGLTSNAIVTAGGNNLGNEQLTLALTAGATGVATSWGQQKPASYGLVPSYGQPTFATGPGTWQLFVLMSNAFTAALYATPRISVPLPATGLTNGATYHVLVQQQGGDSNNYLRIPVDRTPLPGNPTALYRQKGGSSWTSYAASYAIPIAIYDQTPGGAPWHTWEDNGARITTLVYATTPDKRLLGIADGTQFADGTMLSSVAAINYPGTWPAGAWPPLGVTQLA